VTRSFEVLSKALGPVDTIRFMQQFHKGSGDYTKLKEELLKDITHEDIVDGISKMRKNS